MYEKNGLMEKINSYEVGAMLKNILTNKTKKGMAILTVVTIIALPSLYGNRNEAIAGDSKTGIRAGFSVPIGEGKGSGPKLVIGVSSLKGEYGSDDDSDVLNKAYGLFADLMVDISKEKDFSKRFSSKIGGKYFGSLDDSLFALAEAGFKIGEGGLVPFIGGGVAVDDGGFLTLDYNISDKEVEKLNLNIGYEGALRSLAKEAEDEAQENTDSTDDSGSGQGTGDF